MGQQGYPPATADDYDNISLTFFFCCSEGICDHSLRGRKGFFYASCVKNMSSVAFCVA